MKKIGLIINPVAGMGGSVGLKGTDHVVEEALRRGAVPGSEKRAETALRELLPEGSNILRFQRRFDILRVDENSPAALEWIFPDPKVKPEDFPEDTRLRRAAKRYLLSGGRIGWTLGKLRE